MIGILRAVVPLAEGAGGVAGRLEGLGDGLLVEVQPLAAGRDAAHAAARMVAAGEELGARGRADRADEEPVEQRAVARQRIDVRRREVGVAVDAQVAPALVVGQDDDDIRRFRLAGGAQAARQQPRSRRQDLAARKRRSVHNLPILPPEKGTVTNNPFSGRQRRGCHRPTTPGLRQSATRPARPLSPTGTWPAPIRASAATEASGMNGSRPPRMASDHVLDHHLVVLEAEVGRAGGAGRGARRPISPDLLVLRALVAELPGLHAVARP